MPRRAGEGADGGRAARRTPRRRRDTGAWSLVLHFRQGEDVGNELPDVLSGHGRLESGHAVGRALGDARVDVGALELGPPQLGRARGAAVLAVAVAGAGLPKELCPLADDLGVREVEGGSAAGETLRGAGRVRAAPG